jgi:hypothetical protein
MDIFVEAVLFFVGAIIVLAVLTLVVELVVDWIMSR